MFYKVKSILKSSSSTSFSFVSTVSYLDCGNTENEIYEYVRYENTYQDQLICMYYAAVCIKIKIIH